MVVRRRLDTEQMGYRKVGSKSIFDVAGVGVSAVDYDGAPCIHLADRLETKIALHMPVNLTVDGVTTKFQGSANHTNSPLAYLTYTTVESMTVDIRGYLEVVFGNGVVITAPSDDAEFQYEAWHVYNNTGLHMFTKIGGQVCI